MPAEAGGSLEDLVAGAGLVVVGEASVAGKGRVSITPELVLKGKAAQGQALGVSWAAASLSSHTPGPIRGIWLVDSREPGRFSLLPVTPSARDLVQAGFLLSRAGPPAPPSSDSAAERATTEVLGSLKYLSGLLDSGEVAEEYMGVCGLSSIADHYFFGGTEAKAQKPAGTVPVDPTRFFADPAPFVAVWKEWYATPKVGVADEACRLASPDSECQGPLEAHGTSLTGATLEYSWTGGCGESTAPTVVCAVKGPGSVAAAVTVLDANGRRASSGGTLTARVPALLCPEAKDKVSLELNQPTPWLVRVLYDDQAFVEGPGTCACSLSGGRGSDCVAAAAGLTCTLVAETPCSAPGCVARFEYTDALGMRLSCDFPLTVVAPRGGARSGAQ